MSEETDIVERILADFNRGGFESIAWGVHPDVECVPFEGWPGPSVYRGLDGFAELAAEWTENFDEYGIEIQSVTPIEAGALLLAIQRGRIKGEEDWISMPIAGIWSDFEAGRARSVRWFRAWDDAKDAAGVQE